MLFLVSFLKRFNFLESIFKNRNYRDEKSNIRKENFTGWDLQQLHTAEQKINKLEGKAIETPQNE